MDDLNPRLLVDLLRDHIVPDKSLGQHFLLDKDVISRSIEMCSEEGHPLNSNSKVLEIGPGPGSLTLFLLRSKADVVGIEIDNEAILHLSRVFGDADGKLEVISGDALQLKWPSNLTHIVANLPYQISSPVLEKIQQYHLNTPLKAIILLVQDEFSERMSMEHFGSLSPLGLSLWLDFDVKLDRKVPGGAFSPAPRVNSRLVSLNPVDRSLENGHIPRKMFKIITQHCFSSRRKKIRTLLSQTPRRISRIKGWHKSRWKSAVQDLLTNPPEAFSDTWFDNRPDMLEPEEWVIISRRISSYEE
jgi:16S rRNA (adenine1518-N6/adenine1519-N6)-dimethyltransferase|tara:strand:+ start:6543 stop:7448 length:906 start_codon:yes stop_codon:yes gene_type:complete